MELARPAYLGVGRSPKVMSALLSFFLAALQTTHTRCATAAFATAQPLYLYNSKEKRRRASSTLPACLSKQAVTLIPSRWNALRGSLDSFIWAAHQASIRGPSPQTQQVSSPPSPGHPSLGPAAHAARAPPSSCMRSAPSCTPGLPPVQPEYLQP